MQDTTKKIDRENKAHFKTLVLQGLKSLHSHGNGNPRLTISEGMIADPAKDKSSWANIGATLNKERSENADPYLSEKSAQ